jgi:hypothetical protein
METVLLAAGLSTRMHGSQKLLLPWGDETVAAHCVRQALFGLRDILMASPTAPEQSAGRLIVVTGCDAVPVRKALEPIEGQLEAGLFDVQKRCGIPPRPELLFSTTRDIASDSFPRHSRGWRQSRKDRRSSLRWGIYR